MEGLDGFILLLHRSQSHIDIFVLITEPYMFAFCILLLYVEVCHIDIFILSTVPTCLYFVALELALP